MAVVDDELGGAGAGVALVVEIGGTSSSCRARVVEKDRAKYVDVCNIRQCCCCCIDCKRGLVTLRQLDMAPIGGWGYSLRYREGFLRMQMLDVFFPIASL